jgi:UDPglucose 6-dehydrogenase
MNVAVLGLWHLGSVTAACAASVGHDVRGWDPDPATIALLAAGRAPVSERGLDALLAEGLDKRRLTFTSSLADAVTGADVVWITFDTPVDEDDRADTEFVIRQVTGTFPFLGAGAIVLTSSQLPVGSVRRLDELWQARHGDRSVSFACAPENLRLGRAIDVFTNPDRLVVGVRTAMQRERLAELLTPVSARIEWMSVESAEMTKHAINAFLATSVTFVNELATLCESVGADARDVERGLKSDSRIGPSAYLKPGAAFGGGTLARDVTFLRELGHRTHEPTHVMDGVQLANAAHRGWIRRRLEVELGSLTGRRIAIWGLTYKPHTDTLRRSDSIDLCRWLIARGARVQVHDPAARELPEDLSVTRCADPIDTARAADALVVATEWPVYRDVDRDALHAAMARATIVDASRFLGSVLGQDARFRLVSVGAPRE